MKLYGRFAALPLLAGVLSIGQVLAEEGSSHSAPTVMATPVADGGMTSYSGGSVIASDGAAASDGCDPTWTLDVGTLFLHRSRPSSEVLVTNSFFPGGTVLENANQYHFGFDPGYEIDLNGRHILGTEWGAELRYFDVKSTASFGPLTSPAGGVTQFATPLGNTFFPQVIAGKYHSELQSFEASAERDIGIFQVLAGYRHIDLRDKLDMTADVGPGLNFGNIPVHAGNQLDGIQVGARAVWTSGKLSIDGYGKAGIYNNHAENTVFLTQQPLPPFASSASKNHTAYVGEMGASLAYQVTDHIAVKTGYEFVYIDGVALASDQVSSSDPFAGAASVDTSGKPFYHGLFAGVQFRY